MTKRDFFRMIIKLFGLYSTVISLFTVLPSSLTNFSIFKDDFGMLLVIIGSVLTIVSLFLILLFKSDFIIDKLGLDKGFDDDKIILGDLKNEQIFKFAIHLIGGFLIVDYFPKVIFELLNVFKKESSSNAIMGFAVNYFNLIVGIINIIIGLLFITNYKAISNYLDKK
jgi:uncharacterized membrane protein